MALVSFGIFIGVDTASRGVERIYGPLNETAAQETSSVDREELHTPDRLGPSADFVPVGQHDSPRVSPVGTPAHPPAFSNRLGHATGKLLQTAAQNTVELFMDIMKRIVN